MPEPNELLHRLEMLGLKTAEVPSDRLNSATAALTCFPMYMIANLHAWTEDEQFRIPWVELPGLEALREAYVIGQQERYLDLEKPHRRLLATLLGAARACDRVVYEYALDTLNLLFEHADDHLVTAVRTGIAKTIVAVAKASGEGLFGSGPRVSPEERICIERIATVLDLRSVPEAVSALGDLNED